MEKKINTFLINVYKRKDKPRVGSSLKVNLKILKIIFNVIFNNN